MRVVVTRPEIAGRRTAEKLRSLGHEPVLLPLTRAVHHPNAAESALGRPHAALAVTSAEAVWVLASLGGRLSPYLDDPLYAVGDATARAATEIGFRDVHAGPGTGADLAKIIVADETEDTTPLLYLTGKPRSGGLEEGLRLRNLPFDPVEIYEMVPIVRDEAAVRRALVEPQAGAVLLYSRENARLFFDLAKPHLAVLRSLQALCLSAKVAEMVPQEFHRNIKIAGHPNEEGLLALL